MFISKKGETCMTPILHQTPNMTLETVALLYIESHLEALQQWANGYLGDISAIDPAQVRVYQRYLQAFRDAKRPADVPMFWEAFSVEEYLTVSVCFLSEPDLLYKPETYSSDALQKLLADGMQYLADSGMVTQNLSEKGKNLLQAYLRTDACTKAFLAFAEAPSDGFIALAKLIRKNIPAAEVAWDTVRPTVRPFLEQYWQPEYFWSHTLLAANTAVREVYPTLALFPSACILGEVCYCGIFNIDTAKKAPQSRDFLVRCMKALGDANRLEILHMICEKPRYNREIAQALNLSPATVMHHTDALLQCGLIEIAPGKENQKRVYFQPVKSAVARLQSEFCAFLSPEKDI